MNSLGIVATLTAIAAAWTIRALYVDLRRARRRARRLAARNRELLAALDDAKIDLQLWSEIHLAAQQRHPSNVRVLPHADASLAAIIDGAATRPTLSVIDGGARP